MKYNVIPVILNGANMSNVAPPHSFINMQVTVNPTFY